MVTRTRRRRSSNRRSSQAFRTQWVRSTGLITCTNATDHANLLRTIAFEGPTQTYQRDVPEVFAGDDTVSAPEDALITRVFLRLSYLDANASQGTFVGVTVGPTKTPTAASVTGPMTAANSGGWAMWDYLRPYNNQFMVGGGAAGSEVTSTFMATRQYDIKSRRVFRRSMHTLWLVGEPEGPGVGATIHYTASVLIKIP